MFLVRVCQLLPFHSIPFTNRPPFECSCVCVRARLRLHVLMVPRFIWQRTFSHFTIGRLAGKRRQCAPVFVCVLALCSNVYNVEERNLSFPTPIHTSIRHRIQRITERKYCLASTRNIYIYVRFPITLFGNAWFGEKYVLCIAWLRLCSCSAIAHTHTHAANNESHNFIFTHIEKIDRFSVYYDPK